MSLFELCFSGALITYFSYFKVAAFVQLLCCAMRIMTCIKRAGCERLIVEMLWLEIKAVFAFLALIIKENILIHDYTCFFAQAVT